VKPSDLQVFEPLGSPMAELCQPNDERDFEVIATLVNGVARKSQWRAIDVSIIQQDDGRRLQRSDSPWFGADALILRPSAVAALGELLEACGELLPLTCRDSPVCIFNPRSLTGALDEQASSLTRFSSGRIMSVERYAFRSEVVEGVHAFKISELRVSPTFVSRAFVNRWKRAGLVGLEFLERWRGAPSPA
jgi:hypothetical protein